jgi:phage terminase large subunit-like protein
VSALTDDDFTTLREDFLFFAERYKINLFPWQREAFGEATRRAFFSATDARPAGMYFVHPLSAISVARGNGKSWGVGAVGAWRLIFSPPGSLILSTALDYEGGRVVMNHAKTMLRARGLDKIVQIKADELIVEATGSRWIIRSRDHTASRGLHPDVVLYDEAGWAKDDELFASLLAAQASCRDPLFLVTSTVGRRKAGPLWTVKMLAEQEANT